MAVRIPQPPQESREALERELEALSTMEHGGPYLVTDEGLPHRVYTIGLSELAEGLTLSAARQVSWRYLLGTDDRASIAAEVAYDGTAERAHTFLSLNRGPFVQGTIDTLRTAERDPRTTAELELQILRIPALYVMALWLKSADRSRDLLVPMAPVHDALQAGRFYTEHELLDALRRPAAEQLNFDTSPRVGPYKA